MGVPFIPFPPFQEPYVRVRFPLIEMARIPKKNWSRAHGPHSAPEPILDPYQRFLRRGLHRQDFCFFMLAKQFIPINRRIVRLRNCDPGSTSPSATLIAFRLT